MTDVDAKAHDYTEYVSRHLVGMCWYQGPVDSNGEFTRKPDYQCASGFLLQVYDTLCLITAGHVLVDHDRDTKEGPDRAALFVVRLLESPINLCRAHSLQLH